MEAQKTKGLLAAHELQCLKLAKEGYSNEGIAREKVVTKETVEQVFHHIYAKLGLSLLPPSAKRQTAIRYAEKNGWI